MYIYHPTVHQKGVSHCASQGKVREEGIQKNAKIVKDSLHLRKYFCKRTEEKPQNANKSCQL